MRKIDIPQGSNILPGDCIVATAAQRQSLSIGVEDAGKMIIQADTGRMYLATLTEGAKDLTANHIAEHIGMGGIPRQVAVSGIPFMIPPGDGAAVGLQFTGTLGAFTLSAAILTNAWNLLKGCYIWMPASFGGSAYPAGWYWAVFSSDTAGILYTDTYSSGKPRRVASPTAFPSNLSGFITTPTTEITGPTFALPASSIGPNGTLTTTLRGFGNTTANKSYTVKLGTTVVGFVGPVTTNPNFEVAIMTRNQDSEAMQANSRQTATTGIGAAGASIVAGESTSVNTAVETTLSITMTISSTSACAVLTGASVSCTYGD